MRPFVYLLLLSFWSLTACTQSLDRSVQVWFSSEIDTDREDWFAADYPQAEFALSQQEDLPLLDGQAGNGLTLTLDPTQRYQPIEGIGYSLEESTVYNLRQMSAPVREKLLRELLDPEEGIGLNMMRICIGASDFTGREFYTYDDPPGGQPDPELQYFSIQKDVAFGIIEVIKEALSYNPDLRLVATPWSPPAWMKTSGSVVGGSLKPEYQEVYARYLAEAVAAYREEGIPIWAITLQNEPLYVPPDYPGSRMEADQARELAILVSEAFRQKELDTKILVYDHNYDEAFKYADEIFKDKEAYAAVHGTAVHGYSGGIKNLDRLQQEYPEKGIYFTEKAYWRTSGMREIAEIFQHWSRSYLGWVTMLDDELQPEQWTGTPGPTMIIQNAEQRDQYRLQPTYYMLGQFSKFVERGAFRIASAKNKVDKQLSQVAFLNPDGSVVLVLINESKMEQQLAVEIGDYHFAAQVPGLTVATFRLEN
jgi:glucosylceramidase